MSEPQEPFVGKGEEALRPGSTPAVERWMHVFRLEDGTYEIAYRGALLLERPLPAYGTLIARVLVEDPSAVSPSPARA